MNACIINRPPNASTHTCNGRRTQHNRRPREGPSNRHPRRRILVRRKFLPAEWCLGLHRLPRRRPQWASQTEDDQRLSRPQMDYRVRFLGSQQVRILMTVSIGNGAIRFSEALRKYQAATSIITGRSSWRNAAESVSLRDTLLSSAAEVARGDIEHRERRLQPQCLRGCLAFCLEYLLTHPSLLGSISRM